MPVIQEALFQSQYPMPNRTNQAQQTKPKSARRTVSNLISALKECKQSKNLARGKDVHSQAIESGLVSDPYVFSCLIDMYAHCQSMVNAREVFDSRSHSDLVAWNTLLQGYVRNGDCELALELFDTMVNGDCGCSPDARTYIAALTGCATLAGRSEGNLAGERWLSKGKSLHSQALASRCCNIYVENKLIDMYARCRSMDLARQVFDKMTDRTPVSWATLLQGYVDNDQNEVALQIFEGTEMSSTRSFVAALTACANLGTKGDRGRWLEKGRNIHAQAVTSGCWDVYVETTLVGMYSSCGSMDEARGVFDKMVKRNVVSWNALLQGYVDNGQYRVALRMYRVLEEDSGCVPDVRTYVTALAACAALAAHESEDRGKCLDSGRGIHRRALERQCRDIFLESVLVDMYAKCGSMLEARKVFSEMTERNSVAWNSLLQGYVDSGESEVALELFEAMDIPPDARTFVAALNACSDLGARDAAGYRSGWLEKGRLIHRQAAVSRCCNIFVNNMLMHMYAAFGCTSEARGVFDGMPGTRDVVSWNCLLLGYVNNGEYETALKLVSEMDISVLDCGTFIAAVMACGKLLEVENGRAFHGQILRCGFETNTSVATCLVDFYGKCSRMDVSGLVFDYSALKDGCMWDSFMGGYSQQGDTEIVMRLFREMVELRVLPSEITFTHMLCACSRAGMTDRGRRLFRLMRSRFGVTPNFKHYNCLIDLLSRGNHLDEALELAVGMPYRQDVKTWTTILGACVKWKNSAVGKVAYDALLKLNSHDPAAYVLMANVYSSFKSL